MFKTLNTRTELGCTQISYEDRFASAKLRGMIYRPKFIIGEVSTPQFDLSGKYVIGLKRLVNAEDEIDVFYRDAFLLGYLNHDGSKCIKKFGMEHRLERDAMIFNTMQDAIRWVRMREIEEVVSQVVTKIVQSKKFIKLVEKKEFCNTQYVRLLRFQNARYIQRREYDAGTMTRCCED